MIKTLHITSIITVVLAVGFIVFPAVFGVRSDEQIEEFLSSAGAIEKFKNKASGDKNKISESQVSPLVKQAKAFALYLDPPAPIRKPDEGAAKVAEKPSTIRQPSITPKFKLVATSCYALRPEMSLALIDEPGEGLHWVRQSAKVGHLIIEQIKDGLVVVRSGEKNYEVTAERKEETSLLKGAVLGQTGAKSTLPVLDKPAFDKVGASADVGQAGITSSGVSQPSAEESAELMDVVIEQLKAMQAGGGASDANSEPAGRQTEGAALMKEAISAIEAMRVTAEEASKLERLGKTMKDIQHDPNQAKDRSVKTETRPRPRRRPSRPKNK
jgi:hypothetical protein